MLRRYLSLGLGFALFATSTALVAAAPAAAQEAAEADRIYISTFQIDYSDIPAWMANYEANEVPLLQELVDEGVLLGFNIWMHHTGGEYTMRHAFIGHEDTDYDLFWGEYLGRYAERHPEAFARVNAMIQAHEDEVFNMALVNVDAGDAPPRYLYEAKFQVPFGDLDRWGELWEAHFLPVAEQMRAEGRVRGYVIQTHQTGGKYNWKFSWLFDEWDDFDEVEAAFFGALPLDHEVFGMFTAHRDELWQAPPGN